MTDPIKATSNVIELKEGKKYLLVFKSTDEARIKLEALEVLQELESKGITTIGIAIRPSTELEIIEVPAS